MFGFVVWGLECRGPSALCDFGVRLRQCPARGAGDGVEMREFCLLVHSFMAVGRTLMWLWFLVISGSICGGCTWQFLFLRRPHGMGAIMGDLELLLAMDFLAWL